MTAVITYYVQLIKALKGNRNFNILVIFTLSFVFLHMLSSIFICVMGSVFIYIIKFIIEINTVIKVAHKLRRWYLEALALAVAPLVI